MTRRQIVRWAIGIGVLTSAGYGYFNYYGPVAIAAAKAKRAQEDVAVGQRLTHLVCADNIEALDDGRASAENVARAIIAKCGPLMPVRADCRDTECIQLMQRTNLLVETLSVGAARDDRARWAQDRADDAKAALVWAQTHETTVP